MAFVEAIVVLALLYFIGRSVYGGLFTDSVAASKTPSQGALEEGCE